MNYHTFSASLLSVIIEFIAGIHYLSCLHCSDLYVSLLLPLSFIISYYHLHCYLHNLHAVFALSICVFIIFILIIITCMLCLLCLLVFLLFHRYYCLNHQNKIYFIVLQHNSVLLYLLFPTQCISLILTNMFTLFTSTSQVLFLD